MRYGFKAEATSLANEVRAELGLGPYNGLDPFRLAEYLEIPVRPLSAVAAVGPVHFFSVVDTGCFSGLTVFDGHRRLVVYNDAHAPGRCVSDIAHELSHGLLLHEPQPALDQRGFRYHDPSIEEEANFLAGALLVTEAAAFRIVRDGVPYPLAAQQLGVSDDMVRYRVNVTGAEKRVRRARGKSPGRSSEVRSVG
jgi:Zn-dependent peptidase ImmA (M78 family)